MTNEAGLEFEKLTEKINTSNTKKSDGFWYMASPYSKYPYGLEFAHAHACNAAGRLLAAGHHVYSPIAHTHSLALMGGLNPYDHGIFLPLDEKIMKHADGMIIIMMEGWKSSIGIQNEIEHFRRARKPIFYLNWPELRAIEIE